MEGNVILKLGFLNTWEGRAQNYLTWAQSSFPTFDILCLSEVHSSHAPITSNRRNSAPKPGVSGKEMFDQYEQLNAMLHEKYHCRHDASAVHQGDGALYGLVTFCRRDGPRVYGFQAEAVHGYYGAPWPQPRQTSSCSQIVSFFVELEESVLLCSHGHFAWIKDGKDDHLIRDRQSHKIVQHLERRAGEMAEHHKPLHVILGGDFNLRRDLRAFHSVQAARVFGPQGALVLNDQVENGTDTRTALYTKHERSADFVLISQELGEQSSLHIDRSVESDHALLTTAIELKIG